MQPEWVRHAARSNNQTEADRLPSTMTPAPVVTAVQLQGNSVHAKFTLWAASATCAAGNMQPSMLDTCTMATSLVLELSISWKACRADILHVSTSTGSMTSLHRFL